MFSDRLRRASAIAGAFFAFLGLVGLLIETVAWVDPGEIPNIPPTGTALLMVSDGGAQWADAGAIASLVLPTGSEGQVMVVGDAGAMAATTMSGDLSCSTTTPGSCEVHSLTVGGVMVLQSFGGAAPIVLTDTQLEYAGGQGGIEALTYGSTSNSTAGSMSILGEDTTADGGIGGDLILSGGGAPGVGGRPGVGGTAGGVVLETGAGPVAQLQGRSTDFVALGSSPPSSGNIRLSNGMSIVAEDNAGTGNLAIFSTDPEDNVYIVPTSGGVAPPELLLGQNANTTSLLASEARILMVRSDGVQVFATSAPTSVPGGGARIYSTSDDALDVRSSAGQVETVVPIGSGSVTTQAQRFTRRVAYVRIINTGGIDTVPLVSGTDGLAHVWLVCRATAVPSGGAIGDTWAERADIAWSDVGGTVSIIGTPSTSTFSSSSMSSVSASFNVGPSELIISISGLATAIDCTSRYESMVN